MAAADAVALARTVVVDQPAGPDDAGAGAAGVRDAAGPDRLANPLTVRERAGR